MIPFSSNISSELITESNIFILNKDCFDFLTYVVFCGGRHFLQQAEQWDGKYIGFFLGQILQSTVWNNTSLKLQILIWFLRLWKKNTENQFLTNFNIFTLIWVPSVLPLQDLGSIILGMSWFLELLLNNYLQWGLCAIVTVF